MPAQNYRNPAPVEPDPVDPRAELARLGSLRLVSSAPPLHLALIGPLAISAIVALVGALAGVPLLALAPISAACLAVLAWSPVRTRGRSVALHAHGVLVGHAGTQRAVAFEDVDEVWFEMNRLHSDAGAYLRALRIVDFSGGTHILPTTTRDGELIADVVVRACSDPLLREAGRALHEGQTLTFANVQLDREGITVRGKRTAWSDIRRAVVGRGEVQLTRRRSLLVWRTVRLDRIPNPAVFVGLVARCTKETRIDDPLMARVLGSGIPSGSTPGSAREAAMRTMLVGGILFIVGVIITLTTDIRIIAWGPILFGAVRFIQGVVALRRPPPR